MAVIYGYARVSTPKQSLDRQLRNIRDAYPEAIIVSDEWTGTQMQRPGWVKLSRTVAEGDTIVFDAVSRMSRNSEEGVKTYFELFDRGVELVFLKEHHIDTATYKKALCNSVPMTGTAVDLILSGINQYLKELAAEQIRLAFLQAEAEVRSLRSRTKEGLVTARLNGKRLGAVPGKRLATKKSKVAKEVIRKYSKEFGGTLDDAACLKLAGVSRNSFYKYKKEMRFEMEECEKSTMNQEMILEG